MDEFTLDDITRLAKNLSEADRLRLIVRLQATISQVAAARIDRRCGFIGISGESRKAPPTPGGVPPRW